MTKTTPAADDAEPVGELERWLTEAAIARLVTRYAVLSDEGDFEAVTSLFTEDGVLVRPSGGEPVRGRAALLAGFRARPPRISRHVVSNILVDVRSRSEARCSCTLLLYSAAPGERPVKASQPALLGGFADRLVKQDGQWLFAERRGWLDMKVEP